MAVYPDEIAAFKLARRCDFTNDRNAKRFEMSAIDPGFETAGGLAHVRADKASRCDDQGIMGVKGIEGQAIAIGQPDDVGTGLAEDCFDPGEFLLCRIRGRALNDS